MTSQLPEDGTTGTTGTTTSGAPVARPDSGGRLAPPTGEWRRVSPKYLAIDLVSTVIWGAVVTVGSGVPWVLSGVPILVALPIAVAVLFLLIAALTPRRVRAIGYLMREDDLVFRRGILFQRIVAVPYGRMQLVDINRGPLDRAVGLAQLKLVTAAAASGVIIPGLPIGDAESLRDHLVQLAETRRAGL